MQLTNNLKLLRQRHDLSQQQLAAIVGCSRQTIIAVETGCKNPSIELALKIAYALNTSVDGVFELAEGHDKECFLKKIKNFFA